MARKRERNLKKRKWTTKHELLPQPTGPKCGLLFVTSELQEFNTVHGPNFNPDWITWKERELPGPSVKMKKTEVDFVKVKKEEKK